MTTPARTLTPTAAPVLVLDWSEALELDRREQEAELQAECLERLFCAMRDAVRVERQLAHDYQAIHDKTTATAAILRQRMNAARQVTADATHAWRCASR